jgi:hypothetical protein
MKTSHPLEQEELMAYLDGELRPELAASATKHLESCAACRATATGLRGLSQQLSFWKVTSQPMEMPVALNSAVDNYVAAQKKRTAAPRRSWRQILGIRGLVWAGGAAFAVLLLASLVGPKISGKLAVSKQQASVRLEQPNTKAYGQSKLRPNTGLMFSSNYTYSAADQLSGLLPIEEKKPMIMNAPVREGMNPNASAANDAEKPAGPDGPMIVRTAQLSLLTKDFEKARAGAEEILKRHGGYIGELNVNAPEGSGRTLTAVFRVPSAHLDAVLAGLKKLGRVTAEAQSGEEVTQQYIDLQARLANARHTEQRLSDLLRDRSGKLSDVLAFEKEIDRVRGEIESMEAQRKSLAKQVDYAALHTTLNEEYGAPLKLTPPSTSMRFRNAAVEGFQAVAAGIVSVLLFLLSTGPSLLVLGVIIYFLGRLVWKRMRGRIA